MCPAKWRDLWEGQGVGDTLQRVLTCLVLQWQGAHRDSPAPETSPVSEMGRWEEASSGSVEREPAKETFM